MKVGAHVSIAGGIDQAPKRVVDLGGNCLQIFSKNPRGWKAREISAVEAENTSIALRELALDPLVVHIPYLVNLASNKPDLYEKSLDGLIMDLQRTGRIGADYLVLHPGKYSGWTKRDGLKLIAESINIALEKVSNDVILLLENVAGAGSEIGQTFEELQEIIELCIKKARVGICFDTCHGFAAGYDLRTRTDVEQVLAHFDQVIGIDKLKLIHANDAKAELGSKLDRHEHIGLGQIGQEGFRALINHPWVLKHDLPFIVETPVDDAGDQRTDIMRLKKLKK